MRSIFDCKIFRLCDLVLTVSGTRWRPFLGSRKWAGAEEPHHRMARFEACASSLGTLRVLRRA